MKITSKKVDELNRVLTVNVAAEDYAESRRKKLNELKRRAEMPGFRKGMVPMSLIEKMYGERTLGECVNDAVASAVDEYLKKEKFDVVGQPLPTEDNPDREWKAGNDFTFTFDLALNPVVSFEVEKKDEVPFYNITVSADEKKKYAESLRKFDESREESSVKSEEEYDKMAQENLTARYNESAEFRFNKDVRDFYVKKSGIVLPEKFLRRWLAVAGGEKMKDEDIDREFPAFLEDYKWQRVLLFLLDKYKIKIKDSDLKEEAGNYARYQLSMYGMMEPQKEILENVTKNVLNDSGMIDRLVENLQNRKVIEALKAEITVKTKKISSDKFRELK